jgi:hypothetical protein
MMAPGAIAVLRCESHFLYLGFPVLCYTTIDNLQLQKPQYQRTGVLSRYGLAVRKLGLQVRVMYFDETGRVT